MKQTGWGLWALLVLLVMLSGCPGGDTPPDGDLSDGDEADGDVADGDTSDGDTSDGDIPDGDNPDGDTPACWDDLDSAEKSEFLTGLLGSEGIAFTSDGRLYISTKGEVLRVLGDGTVESLAELIHPIGMAGDDLGNLVVADYGATFEKDDLDGVLVRFAPDGSSERLAESMISNPNFVTRTPWGSYLVSDDLVPEIWEVTDEGQAALWCDKIPSPNGMVFSSDGLTLFVASTFDLPSPVYAIAIDDTQAGAVSTFVELGKSQFNDGIAMDEEGRVYVAANGAGKIIRLDREGNPESVAEGMLTPASIAFGEGEDFDPCSIYVTELLGGTLWRVPLGVRGQPVFR